MAVFRQTYQIRVRGLVQGVGFRPFVWQVAREIGLSGTVCNDAQGVLILINASPEELAEFTTALRQQCPPLAVINSLESESSACTEFDGFEIVASEAGQVSTGSVPDAATCGHCLGELFDPQNRRYRYPFINCTHCGPRLSITQGIPYDRATTTMSDFVMCPICQQEYENPADRRFHAQPNACADCGPRVWLTDANGAELAAKDPFAELQARLIQGDIVAIKGLGGFHLVCDATNEDAVAELRRRKNRPAKPFALMAASEKQVARYAALDGSASELLASAVAPVLLLDRIDSADNPPLADAVAPGVSRLGFMLPYTPIHHLLMAGLSTPLVMTSGNPAGAPQCVENSEALSLLAGIADLFLLHDRRIHNRVDDSVAQSENGQLRYLRRARGAAPEPLALPDGFEAIQKPLLALGGELKNTICLLQDDQAIISQHLGDLEDARTYQAFEETVALYQALYQLEPTGLVVDKHPEYLSTKYGEAVSARSAIPLLKVQHHHAHIASCLGENRYPLDAPAVLGICLDGLGFGEDGTIWGGELLLADYRQSVRLGHLKRFELVGGSQAIREPWRCLYAQLRHSLDQTQLEQAAEIWPELATKPLATIDRMIEKGLNAPQASSCGRLFDAVAAALECSFAGISYEGQAAIELEALASACENEVAAYPLVLEQVEGMLEIDWRPVWPAIVADLAAQRPRAEIARAFHQGLVDALVGASSKLKLLHGFSTVALSGGVMQNRLLHQSLRQALTAAGFEVLSQNRLPANDGGLSFGQALVALASLGDRRG